MSEQIVQLVREALDRFVAKGEVFWEILDEQVVIEDHDIPDTRGYRGHAGFLKWLADWGEPWAKWSLKPQEFIDAGDKVVAVLRMRATGRGKRSRGRPGGLARLRLSGREGRPPRLLQHARAGARGRARPRLDWVDAG